MADRTYVISEIVGTSPVDVNTAIRNGIKRAHETLRNLDWFELAEVRGAILDGEVNPLPGHAQGGVPPRGHAGVGAPRGVPA